MSDYKDRAKEQCLNWVNGLALHNIVDDECCPDFSCCCSDLFEKDKDKRLAYYHKHYGNLN